MECAAKYKGIYLVAGHNAQRGHDVGQQFWWGNKNGRKSICGNKWDGFWYFALQNPGTFDYEIRLATIPIKAPIVSLVESCKVQSI